MASIISKSTALPWSGRLSVKVATPSVSWKMIFSVVIFLSGILIDPPATTLGGALSRKDGYHSENRMIEFFLESKIERRLSQLPTD
jgi:hypothetical protein